MRFKHLVAYLILSITIGVIGAACRSIPMSDSSLAANKNQSQKDRPQSAMSMQGEDLNHQLSPLNIPTLGTPTLGTPTLGNNLQNVTPVLVFLGGFTSCKDPLQGFRSIDQTRAAKLLEIMRGVVVKKGQTNPLWLLACQFNNQESFIYKISTSPKVIRQSGLSELAKSLSSLAATVQAPEVYLIGHSYGGWAAMKLAQSLVPNVKIRALVGIDPISGKTCKPEQFIDSILKRPATGCTEAPSDITSSDRISLASRIQIWLNLYQLESRLLHSGVIANAENSLRKYPGRGLLAHGDIFDDPALESQILGLLPP